MGLMKSLKKTLQRQGKTALQDTAAALQETADTLRDTAKAEVQRRVEEQVAPVKTAVEPVQSVFDQVMNGANRLPRPAMAMGSVGILGSAMVDPEWFAARMAGLDHVPEPLWWLLGGVVSFYFCARHQTKGQELKRDMARIMAEAVLRAQSASETEDGTASKS